MSQFLKCAVLAVSACMLTTGVAHAELGGIQALVALAQMKSEQANEEALHGAEAQRELVQEEERLRGALRHFDDLARSGNAAEQPSISVTPRLHGDAIVPCRNCILTAPPQSDDNEGDDGEND